MQLEFDNEGKRYWTVWGRVSRLDKFDSLGKMTFNKDADIWGIVPADLNGIEPIELDHTLKESFKTIKEMYK